MKVFDCFTFNGEYDILDIRFNILNEYVDKFVICESVETFSGKWKPLYWAERDIDRFEEWEDKVVYHIADKVETDDPFVRAGKQKDSIREVLTACEPEDTIYYGDVDEIWKPQTREGKLRQLAYSYYLNQRSSEDWQGTNVFKYKNIRDLNDIRADHSVVLENGGWHFTNMGGYEQILKKLGDYDHQEANIPWVRENLKYRIEQGQDFLGRSHDWRGNEFKMWIDENELPQYLLDNKKRWEHLFK